MVTDGSAWSFRLCLPPETEVALSFPLLPSCLLSPTQAMGSGQVGVLVGHPAAPAPTLPQVLDHPELVSVASSSLNGAS